ncbi:MAG: sigma-70 family RNA polymerase sigma factor [Pirellulaceae bacterium]
MMSYFDMTHHCGSLLSMSLTPESNHYADWQNDPTPTSLWDRVLDGDSSAWQNLVDVWTPCIFEFCRRKGIQEADAGDVVQHVMIRVFRFREKFSRAADGHRLKAWLLMIIGQAIADYYRQFAGKNRAQGGSDFADQMANLAETIDSGSAADSIDGEQLFDPGLWMARTLEVIRAEVTEQTWQVFEMFKIKDRTAKEVGEHFGLKETTVRQRVFTVTQRIKREAEGLFDDAELST